MPQLNNNYWATPSSCLQRPGCGCSQQNHAVNVREPASAGDWQPGGVVFVLLQARLWSGAAARWLYGYLLAVRPCVCMWKLRCALNRMIPLACRSDGPQPHLINIEFLKKTAVKVSQRYNNLEPVSFGPRPSLFGLQDYEPILYTALWNQKSAIWVSYTPLFLLLFCCHWPPPIVIVTLPDFSLQNQILRSEFTIMYKIMYMHTLSCCTPQNNTSWMWTLALF